MNIRYTHTNINAKDWRKLSLFYQTVFGCKPEGPIRELCGSWFEQVTGVPGASVTGQHISLPGYPAGGPTLEIFTYNIPEGKQPVGVNGYGFAHIAFHVEDVDTAYQRLLQAGGSSCGQKVVEYYSSLNQTLTVGYARDPEGNVVEILNWAPGNTITYA